MRRQDGDPAVLVVGGRTSPSLMVSGGGRLFIARPDLRRLIKSLGGDFAIFCVYEGGAKRPFLFADVTIVEDIYGLDGRGGRGHLAIDPLQPVPRHFGLTTEALVVAGGAIEAEEFGYCLLLWV